MVPAHPIKVASPDRLAEVAGAGLLDTPMEEAFDRLTRLAAEILRAPVSLFSLIDSAQDREFFKSSFGLPEPWASKREIPLAYSFCKKVVDSGEPLIISDTREHPEGTKLPQAVGLGVVAYAGIPVRFPTGEVAGAFCVIDTKPRHWTNFEIRTLENLTLSVMSEIALRLVIQTREELLEAMAHDLRNPLSAVLLSAEMLSRASTGISAPAQFSILAQRIRTAGRRMESLIQDLANLTQLESHSLILEKKEQSLGELANEALEILNPLAEEKSIHLRIKSTPEIHAAAFDTNRIYQVFFTLITNAIHYSPANSEVLVEINIKTQAQTLQVSVSDQGKTIPPEDLPHLFERFSKSRKSVGSSVGMGLYISYELVTAHGGQIWAENRAGGGRTFYFTLPITTEPKGLRVVPKD